MHSPSLPLESLLFFLKALAIFTLHFRQLFKLTRCPFLPQSSATPPAGPAWVGPLCIAFFHQQEFWISSRFFPTGTFFYKHRHVTSHTARNLYFFRTVPLCSTQSCPARQSGIRSPTGTDVKKPSHVSQCTCQSTTSLSNMCYTIGNLFTPSASFFLGKKSAEPLRSSSHH